MALLSVTCFHYAALVIPSDPFLSRRTAILGATATTMWKLGASAPAEATADVATSWTLPGGIKMPTLALNTAGLTTEGSELALTEAVAAGIMHVDFHPGIERDGVARALRLGVDRSKVFLTTKIAKPAVGTSPSDAAQLVFSQLDRDLDILGISQVDMLMLRDSPDCTVMQAQWAAMEQVLDSKRARSIGVINVSSLVATPTHLDR